MGFLGGLGSSFVGSLGGPAGAVAGGYGGNKSNAAGAVTGGTLGSAFGPAGAYAGTMAGSGGSIWTPWSHGDQETSNGAPPIVPSFQGSDYNPAQPFKSTGTSISAPNIDQSGINAYRSLALGDTSPWVNDRLAQEAQSTLAQKDQATAGSNSQVAQAEDNLAMNGGLRSGAAERIASQGGIGNAAAQQGINQASEGRKLAIQTSGRDQQLQALSNLPGMEIANARPGMEAQEFNVNAGLNEAGQQNQYNEANAAALNNYNLNQNAQKNAFNMGTYGINSSIYGNQALANQAADQRANQSLWDKIF